MPIFQSIPVVNGLSKGITFVQIWKMQFFESFFSFPSEIDNKGQIHIFYWLIINSLNPASNWQQHQGL